ncbi:MAG: MFS transporter [Myxococcota bacterium]
MNAGQSRALARRLLLFTTAVAVVSDALLIPFYPDLFALRFGVESSSHVGLYLAATCLMVVVVLPGWARIERRIGALPLLVGAQAAAGLLAIACHFCTDVTQFWAVSVTMIAFKASYLLVYPFLLRLETPETHATTIGLLTVLVHLGGIAGATVGGGLVGRFGPESTFLGMAAGDFIQMVACASLYRRAPRILDVENAEHGRAAPDVDTLGAAAVAARGAAGRRLLRLAAVMLLAYLAVFSLRPFFVAFWREATGSTSELLAGLVFATPAGASIAALLFYHRTGRPMAAPRRSLPLAGFGLLVILTGHPVAIIAGLAIFGWGAFESLVKLDTLIFENRPPSDYAVDFSLAHISQQLGALAGFMLAGFATTVYGFRAPFVLAIVTLLLSVLVFEWLFRPRAPEVSAPSGLPEASS